MTTKGQIIQVSAYYPPHLGGQEYAVQDLARQLADAGYRVMVMTSAQGSGKHAEPESAVAVRRFRGVVFGHAPIMPALPWALLRHTRQSGVVHLHIGQAFTPEIVWLTSRLRRFKYIAQLHIDFEPSGPAGVLLPLYKRLILKRVLRAANAVIVLNEETRQAVRRNYGVEARIVPNGIDEVYFKLKRAPQPSKPPKTLRLLFVGRLTGQKNIPALLGALQRTKRRVHLDVIGDGEERVMIQDIIQTCGLTNVTMHGRLSRAEVMNFYRTSHALIIPSLYEAQPLVLLEALAARIPVIATDVIGVAEHLQNKGIVVPPTPQGLAEGIDAYYERYASLPDMVRRGYITAEGLRWRHTLKKYEALYAAVQGS